MATPLSYLYGTNPMPAYYTIKSLFLGFIPGSIGELSSLLLLLGGLYLIARKVISWRIPVSFIGTVALLALLFGHSGFDRVDWMCFNVLSGGLVLGAVFMATDYTTTPITARGRMLFALGCGLITFVIRRFCALPEGVSYSILCMNILAPWLEKWTRKKPLGGV